MEIREQVEAELLERLVALNHERAEEEKAGKIRWLRPEFQNPDGQAEPATEQQGELEITPAKKKTPSATAAAKLTWPARLPEQFAVINQLLKESAAEPDRAVLSARFDRKSGKREEQIGQILETLAATGLVN